MEKHIDEIFKDLPPEQTVANIQRILYSIGIEVEEKWSDSGIAHCYSLSLKVKDGYPSSNGKGVTKALARASAYAEFIERLQQGLHYYKLQSVGEDPEMDLHTFAPDAKYMTEQELIDDGVWMDYLIESYGNSLSREKIAYYSKVFSCSKDDKILTLPYYSIFENKYVYLPAGFIEQVYASNGCCAGNTPEEALTHAISEIIERKCKQDLLISGKSVPAVPDDILNKFPTVSKILKQIKDRNIFDISVLDISDGSGFPVIATRIVNKKTHDYWVNAAADPVLEIAIQRTLTELLQGKNIDAYHARHSSVILKKPDDVPLSTNAWNSLESSQGLFTADFFADLEPRNKCTEFHNNTNKSNKELLQYAYSICKRFKKPVYIRNYSYLGFTCYKVVIPGYSEGNWLQFFDPVSEYAFGANLRKAFLNITTASHSELTSCLLYSNMISGKVGKFNKFSRIAGIPISGSSNIFLPYITLAYASYKLKRYKDTIKYCKTLISATFLDEDTRQYLSCIIMYLDLTLKSIDVQKIKSILPKFFFSNATDKLLQHLNNGESPFNSLVLKCDLHNCGKCSYSDYCSYNKEKSLIHNIGQFYNKFHNGQDKANFPEFINKNL